MTINQTGVVDFISIEPAGNVKLTISDHLEWEEDTGEHLLLLQEKLNSYLAFVESGEILKTYPKAEGKAVVISIYCKYSPNELARRFIHQATATIEAAGMKLQYEVISDK